MNVSITGLTGFVGSHLAEFILAHSPETKIYGFARWRAPRVNIAKFEDDVTIIEGDLMDYPSVLDMIDKVRPSYIFHLAAQSYVQYSFAAPIATLEANCIGTANLLEAVKHVKQTSVYDPIVHICSSSEVYGQVEKGDIPITEKCPLRPASPYAVSKVCEDMLGYQYFLSWGIKTIRSRMFTHSISYDSPVIVRDDMSLIDIIPISDIRKARDKLSQELWDFENNNLEVWDGQQFTKILNISAHKLNLHKLLQIDTRGGIIQVTDNHSVFDDKDSIVDAGDLKIDDKIAVLNIPKEPSKMNSISSEFAWLLGFLVAEGCVKDNRRICFSNNDETIITKCKKYISQSWGKSCSVSTDTKSNHILSVLNAKEFALLFDNSQSYFSVYTKCSARATGKRYKRVPKIILNSTLEIQRSFLEGYNTGDGRKNANLKSDFQEFKTSSPVLACGLIYIINNVTKQEYTLNCEKRVLSTGKSAYYYSVNLRSNSGYGRQKTGQHFCKDKNSIKNIRVVSESPNEMVYDIETESHAFSCGIGSTKVHNTGPRRGDVFAVSTFAKQIAKIESKGSEGTVKVGNLNSTRTFADVRDAVRAYWIMVHECTPGEVYNIGGKETMSVGQMLEKLIQLSTASITIEVDQSRLRPSDVTEQIPCCDKFHKVTGWEPEIPFDKTLIDTLDHWRNFFRKQNS